MASVWATSAFAMASGWDRIVRTRRVHRSVESIRDGESARKAFVTVPRVTVGDYVISVTIHQEAAGVGLQPMPKA